MKNQQKNKIAAFTIGMFTLINTLPAQQDYQYKANIPPPPVSGFYSIRLQPGFIAGSKADYADIRLADNNNTFQPYLLKKTETSDTAAGFVILPLVPDSSQTACIVANTTGISISSLYLQLRNTAVIRTASVLGSDDNIKWFAVKDNVIIEPTSGNNGNNYEQKISFPASNYRYLKIQLNENKKAPVSIIQAGTWIQPKATPEYEELPGTGFRQTDSAGYSIITLQLPEAYQINKLQLTIPGTRFYQRNVTLYQVNKQQQEFAGNAVITSAGGQDIFLTAKTAVVKIYIHNGDNPPLAVQSVKAWQQTIMLISYLEKGKQYQLLTGNTAATLPVYDLQYFKDSIRNQPQQLNHEQVTANPLYNNQPAIKKQELPGWLVWVAIGMAITILTILSVKMTKEINRAKK